jgi:hypothetical protein
MASQDLNEIFREALGFAEYMLKLHGEFLPFGVSMRTSGEVAQVHGSVGVEHPASADVVDLLQAEFQREAGKGSIRAAGVCINMLVVPPGEESKTDAICVRLAHVSGETAVVYVPYDLNGQCELVLGATFRSSHVDFRFGPQVQAN